MYDDLAAYFFENVVVSFDDYRAIKSENTAGRSRDIRTAMIAASSLFHLREHLPRKHALSRGAVERLCPDYGVLADMTNASKHKSISAKTPHGDALISDASDLREEIVVTEYKDDQGPYRRIDKRVVASLSDGTTRDVLEILTNVMNFWHAHLYAVGIVSTPHQYRIDSHEPRSRAECEEGRLDLEMLRGVRFATTFRLQRYNYDKCGLEAVDLTGSAARFTVYQPSYEVDVVLRRDATGVESHETIVLSEEESIHLASLRTDFEREEYVNSLPRAMEALKRLLSSARQSGLGDHGEAT